LPVGYEVTYGGQFENLAEGSARLAIAVPASLLLILILLYLTFGSLLDAVMVFTAIPLSAIGGVAALLVRGLPFSISAGVGFIALFGVSALNGIVLMAAFRKLRSAHHTNMIGVVVRGTTERIRPVMMTALVASLGFLPMALSTGDGAEVQRPLATVVIGGLITSTLLTMVVLPVLYYVVYRRQAKRHHQRRTKAPYHAVALLFLLLPVAALAQPTVVPRDTVRALALRANLDVIIATSKAAQAERLKGASVDLGPTSLTWMGGQYNAVDFDNAFGISQGVPWPGKLAASSRLYDEQAREAQLESVWTRRTVMVETELAMDRVAYTHELLLIMARLDSILARSVRSAVARQKAGDATQLERVLPESQLSELRARHKQFETQLQNAETQLRVLCGDTAVTIADTLLSRRLLTRDTALAASVSQRYAQRLHTAQAKADVAASSWWPDFTLGYVNQSLIGAPLGNGRQAIASDRFQYVQVGVSLPLWFGPVRAREQQADLDVMLADAEARRRTVHAEHERQQLLRTIRALENSLDHYEGPAREESRVLVEHSSQAYEAGDIGWLELQQSLERALTINLNRLEALLDHNEAVIQLELLTGQQP
jgi:cobalt-zinc-cadmium resistance protein CzcA